MITMTPEILHLNGTTKIKVTVRDGDGGVLDAETLTIESGVSRKKFAKRLAEKTGQGIDDLEKQLLAMLDVKPEPPQPKATSEGLLAAMPEKARRDAEEMLNHPLLILQIRQDLKRMGVVGRGDVAIGTYISGVSRLLDRPVSVIVRGATSSGKSYESSKACKFFPPETILLAHHMSAKSLLYMEDDALVHKLVVGGERPRRQDDDQSDATKLLREMLSDGVLRAAVTETIDGALKTHVFEKRGPIAFVETTSAATVFEEDLNRCLTFYVDETKEQTAAIMSAAAERAAGRAGREDPDLILKHHAIQRMLKPLRVLVPFAPLLAQRMPNERVEARRAMNHLLGTIQAVALLRQYRKAIHNNTITADAEDYRVALEVVTPTMQRLAGGIDAQARRVLEAIKEQVVGDEEFTRRAASCWAGISESDCGGRLRLLVSLGELVETQEHRGSRPAKYRLDDKASPNGDVPVGLPSVHDVDVWGGSPPENTSRQQIQPDIAEDLSARTPSSRQIRQADNDDLSICQLNPLRADKSPEFIESKSLSARNSARELDTHHETAKSVMVETPEGEWVDLDTGGSL